MGTGEGKPPSEARQPTLRVGVTEGSGNGAAGVDGMSISQAPGFIRQNWEAICSTLENGTNIRTVQELMGHKDVKTTEIYTHVMSKDLDAVKSPLDLL